MARASSVARCYKPVKALQNPGHHMNNVPLEHAHIVPWNLASREKRFDLPLTQCIELLFGTAVALHVFAQAGGPNVNSVNTLMLLTPTFHKMHDKQLV
jgi:hypothetical protein